MIKKIMMVFCLLLIACDKKPSTPADPVVPEKQYLKAGRSPYALQSTHFDCNILVNNTKSTKIPFSYSWLYKTFDNVGDGNFLECVYKLNGMDETKMMQVHLINEVCQKHGRCGSYEFLKNISVSDYNNKLKNKDAQLLASLRNYIKTASERILPSLRQETRCLVSPGLESNLDTIAGKVLIDLTREYFGTRCEIVWNPLNAGTIPGTIHEKHGITPNVQPPCVVNLDGKDIDLAIRKSNYSGGSIKEADLLAYINKYQMCEMVFLWVGEDNCIQSGNFVDPRNRTKCTGKNIEDALKPYITKEK